MGHHRPAHSSANSTSRAVQDRGVVNDETEALGLGGTVTAEQEVVEPGALLEESAAGALPVHAGPQLRREITVLEDVIGKVSNDLELLMAIELDALGGSGFVGTVNILIAEPHSRRTVGDDEPKRILGALANAAVEELLNGGAATELVALMLLPPCQRAELSLDEALRKEVVKDVLEVGQLVVGELELDELRRRGLVAARTLVVGQPKLSLGHYYRVGRVLEQKEEIGRAHV